MKTIEIEFWVKPDDIEDLTSKPDLRNELIRVYEEVLKKVIKESFLESEGAYAEALTALAQGAEIKKRMENERKTE